MDLLHLHPAGTAPLFISGSELEHAITIADAVKRLENFLLDGLCPEQDLAVAAAAYEACSREISKPALTRGGRS